LINLSLYVTGNDISKKENIRNLKSVSIVLIEEEELID